MAGYQHYDKFGDLNAEGLKIHFDINAIGPLLMVQALRQNLGKGTKVMRCLWAVWQVLLLPFTAGSTRPPTLWTFAWISM